MLRTENALVDKIFESLKLSKNQIIAEIQKERKNANESQKTNNAKELPYDADTKNYFDQAREISKELGDKVISSEHLFLAFCKDENELSSIYKIFQKNNLKYELIKETYLNILKNQGSKTPYLDKFGNDLTMKAKLGKLDPIIGRFDEIEQAIQILSRRRKNNPLLYGDPGVGKTAIVEGIALQINKNESPNNLKNKRIIELSLNSIIAGASKRGEYEERLGKILEETKNSNGEIILFIDEIHTIVKNENSEDAANILKPALARGEIQTIGATTTAEYHRYFVKDRALERRFQPLQIQEPSIEDCFFLIKGIKNKYEQYHQIEIPDNVIFETINLSIKYITNRFLPDKALDVIDESCSVMKMPNTYQLGKKESLKTNIEFHQNNIKKAQTENNLIGSNQSKERIAKLEKDFLQIDKNIKAKADQHVLEMPTIKQVICRMSNLPLYFLNQEEGERVSKTEEFLKSKIIGQNEAIKEVSNALIRNQSGLKKKDRPIGSFIFLGPTGVGKTELAEDLALHLFGTKDALIRFDMSEYGEKHSAAKLIGAPPGYIGYEEGGQLTEKIKNRPYAVVLFDEIEKANPEVFNLLLQLLDEGHLTDNQGNKINFKNTIIICTSNLGQQTLNEALKKTQNKQEKKKLIIDELKKFLKLELINRFDDLISFNNLTEEDIMKICDLLLAETKENLSEQNINLTLTDQAKVALAKIGFDPILGARPLKYAIQQEIETPIANLIISKKIQAGTNIICDYQENKFIFNN